MFFRIPSPANGLYRQRGPKVIKAWQVLWTWMD
jgi:hypothetical protein